MVQCKAKSKRSGVRCRKHAVKGKSVCRIHGAYGGPKTPEGRARIKAARTKHGYLSKEAIQERRALRSFIRECCNV